jgi:hypothetical protein
MIEPIGSESRSACGTVDITEAVYDWMVPDWARERLRVSGSLTEDEHTSVFCRLFPSMRQEAQRQFLEGGERGVVFCSAERIEYVPERSMAVIAAAAQIEVTKAIRSYNPLVEAVVVLAGDGLFRTVIAAEGNFPYELCS